MADVNKVFGLFRVIAMGISILLSVLVLVMAALVTSFTLTNFAGYFVYAIFAIVVACLTIITVSVMLFISINRKGAFTSMVVIELSWIGLLWILWLAAGGVIVSVPWLNYCATLSQYYAGTQEACMETQAMAAFAFLNWLVLMALNITLFSLAITRHTRGNTDIWTDYVTDADFSALASPPAMTMDAQGGGYPPPGVTSSQFIPPRTSQYQQQQFPDPQQQQQFTGSQQQPQFTGPQQQPQLTGGSQQGQFTTPSPQPQYMPQTGQV